MKSPVNLYLRVRLPDGTYPYLKAAYTSNGRIRPNYAIHGGRAVEFPIATYHLRYWRDGRRVWESAGDNASLALVAMQRTALALQTSDLSDPGLTPNVPVVPSAVTAPDKRLLGTCAKTYIDEITEHKSAKTLAAYRLTVKSFCVILTGISIDDLIDDEDFFERVETAGTYIEDITREDVLSYASELKKAGCAKRTVRNRIDHLQIFLHRFKLPTLLKGNDLPTYTQKKVRAYNAPELRKMFEHASIDESDLLHFLLCTGAREQEAQFVCWTDVDLERKAYTVTEHVDLGFKPKDKEEGTVPIPDLLVEVLKARRVRYPKSRLIFPGKNGKPNGHALRIVKCLALRAGANCGQCTNKQGRSCATHPVCKHILLHKMRKTFASTLHHNGLSRGRG